MYEGNKAILHYGNNNSYDVHFSNNYPLKLTIHGIILCCHDDEDIAILTAILIQLAEYVHTTVKAETYYEINIQCTCIFFSQIL